MKFQNFAEIYDKLNQQPNIQDIIKHFYYTSLIDEQTNKNRNDLLKQLNELSYMYNKLFGLNSRSSIFGRKITFANQVNVLQKRKFLI